MPRGRLADGLDEEAARLLDFAAAARLARGGFGWLDQVGRPDVDRPVPLWVTCRMTHVFALAHLRGRPGSGALADHGVAALGGVLRDHEHGGWFAAVGADGPVDRAKVAYGHAFVVLAAASAVAAGRPGAADLLAEARQVFARFRDPATGLLVDAWDAGFDHPARYRGANACMHAVEALLAVADVTGEDEPRERALAMTDRLLRDVAARHDWRLPEHYDEAGRPLLEHHRDRPDDPFQPYGATVGHGLEWARLAAQQYAAGGPAWLLTAARGLFARAVDDGWDVDGRDGFVYTVDWAGRPVVRLRMHWVAAEAVAAASVLGRVTGEEGYRRHERRWWDWIDAHLRDGSGGSWHHELGPDNRPSSEVWQGKPDVYHAYQAVLLPQVPVRASVVGGVLAGRAGSAM